MADPGVRRQYAMAEQRCGEGQWGQHGAWGAVVGRVKAAEAWSLLGQRERRVGAVGSLEAAAASEQAGASGKLAVERKRAAKEACS